MNTTSLFLGLNLAILIVQPSTLAAAEVALNVRIFTVPDGFTVETVASTDLVPRPVSGSFDDQGRLYLTDSSGSNKPPSEQLKNPDHRVVRLDDINGDGIFDKSTVFADRVMFPQGCLWHDGWVYVAAPPSIWRFRDQDGDGVAEQREEWFKGGSLTGCANDIHGPHLGPEGFIYWTKGAFAEQTHKLANGRTLNDRAAHIYRARPDGSGLDVIMSGGMDNPVEIAFTAEGEAIFTSTFIDFTQPGFRDGIAHASYGGVFGKVNDVLDDGRVKRTGPELLHPFHQAGPAAECGLFRYEGDALGQEYRDNIFATTFNLHKVTRHVLRLNGASYASTDSDFLATDDTDFHPTDVLQDADGSIIVVDTGGWYKLCCPSSQLAKPDVLGAVYRVKRAAAKPLPSGGRRAAYARLAQPPTTRDDSKIALAKREVSKANPDAAPLFRDLIKQNMSKVSSSPESAHLVRVGAEGLGRLRDASSVALLLEAAAGVPAGDVALVTSLTYALIEIAQPATTRAGLTHSSPAVRRAALVALDQMDGTDLKPAEVTPFLTLADKNLRAAANWILGRHSDWGGELAGWFRQELTSPKSSPAHLDQLQSQLRILTRAEAGQQLLADAATQKGFAPSTRTEALNAMADAGMKQPPAVWKSAVIASLANPDVSVARAARSFSVDPAVQAALTRAAAAPGNSASVRLELLAALPNGAALDDASFKFIRGELAPSREPAMRAAAAAVLARARLTAGQLHELADALITASPVELPRLIAAFEQQSGDDAGRDLLAALGKSAAAKSLPAAIVRTAFAKFPTGIQNDAASFIASLDADAARQSARLDSLLVEVKGHSGDIRRGQAVFNNPKAACVTCHKIGYIGGTLGPDLTRISEIRNERDLLEALVYPSASFVRSYEPMLVSTKSGEEHSGVLRKDAPDEVILASGPNAEVRIARADVASMRPGSLSLMPQGLDEQLTRQELSDLLAFLRNTTWGPR